MKTVFVAMLIVARWGLGYANPEIAANLPEGATMETNQATDNEEDPYQWLEEIQGEKALAWVREQNQATMAAFETVPEFALTRERILEILDSQEQIVSPTLMGEYVYNFWQDADHRRGLWRRLPAADSLRGQTD